MLEDKEKLMVFDSVARFGLGETIRSLSRFGNKQNELIAVLPSVYGARALASIIRYEAVPVVNKRTGECVLEVRKLERE